MPDSPPTAELLAKYAELMNEHGPDSAKAEAFAWQHRDNAEFVELAELSNKLKKALTARGPRGQFGGHRE